MKLRDSVVLVTGANRGIGLEFARELVFRGAKVYAAARDQAAVGIDGVIPLSLDITDASDVSRAAATATDVNVLVNNAGVAHAQNLVDGDLDQIRHEIDVNLFGTLSMIRAFAPVITANGNGAIVNVLSAASWFTFPGSGSYAVSKSAEWSLTNGVRLELESQNIQVVGAHVGMVDTDMSASITMEKMPPEEFVRLTLDAVEEGRTEVVADELSRTAKMSVSGESGVYRA